jgi:ribose-phosphate pyrophosphokinase
MAMKVFTGNANKALAAAICKHFGDDALGTALVDRFPDGETRVRIQDNVRGADVFVIQPTCPPVNDNLMELLIMLDALKRSSPKRITAVIPYYGYSRQDRKHGPREPITAKLVADLITAAGPDRILFLDLHADQIQGFFDIPVDNLLPDSLFVEYLQEKKLTNINTVIVAPDVGGARRARRIAKYLNMKIALVENRLENENPVANVVGTIEENAVIVDDMIDTGVRLRTSAEILKKHGAKHVYACATHPVLSGDMNTLQNSEVDEIMVTDSIPVPPQKQIPKLKVRSVAPLLGEAIRRIHNEESLSFLFDSSCRLVQKYAQFYCEERE